MGRRARIVGEEVTNDSLDSRDVAKQLGLTASPASGLESSIIRHLLALSFATAATPRSQRFSMNMSSLQEEISHRRLRKFGLAFSWHPGLLGHSMECPNGFCLSGSTEEAGDLFRLCG